LGNATHALNTSVLFGFDGITAEIRDLALSVDEDPLAQHHTMRNSGMAKRADGKALDHTGGVLRAADP
jgi:hypothetical protein